MGRPPLTLEEFQVKLAEGGMTQSRLEFFHLEIVPCACGADICQGWRVAHKREEHK